MASHDTTAANNPDLPERLFNVMGDGDLREPRMDTLRSQLRIDSRCPRVWASSAIRVSIIGCCNIVGLTTSRC